MSEATRLIDAVGRGDPHAAAELLPLIYDELRRLARSQMTRERPEHTLQATALVHEAYLRLIVGDGRQWDGRRHFFAAAAEAMRRILVEHARAKKCPKRGGGCDRLDVSDDRLPAIQSPCDKIDDLLELNDALDRLAHEHAEAAQLVKLLYFTGLSLDEAAAVVGIPRMTAYRRSLFARAWLRDALWR